MKTCELNEEIIMIQNCNNKPISGEIAALILQYQKKGQYLI